jgi:large conductance mechanosensitive channel protein
MKKFVEEFKTFALRGNVMDLAVGVIIGGAFGAITTSLINDVIMPFLGMFIGGVDFSDLAFELPALFGAGGEPNMLRVGMFIQAVINFIVLALVVFCLVKGMNRMRKKDEPAPEPEAEPTPSNEAVLLSEIKGLLEKMGEK